MVWCFDTSAFLEPWNRHYPIAIAPQLWDVIDEMWEDGEIVVPEEVLHETKRYDDAVHNWLLARKDRLREPTDDVQQHVRTIMRSHPGLVAQGKGRSGGDPWMIGTAVADAATVVTYEGFAQKQSKIKIPDVCRDLGVECLEYHQFLRNAGITLGATRRAPDS